MVQEHSHQFKQASRRYEEDIIGRQAVQARIADIAMWLHAYTCTLSKLDHDIKTHGVDGGAGGAEWARDRAAAEHFFDLAEQEIHTCFRALYENPDDSMLKAASAAISHNQTLPNDLFIADGDGHGPHARPRRGAPVPRRRRRGSSRRDELCWIGSG
jgi:hypothetical protein